MKYDIKSIPNNIKCARLYRNYSQDYLAMKLNISQNGYSKLELGYSKMSLEKFLMIAEVLEFSPLDLILGIDNYLDAARVVNG